MKANHGPSIHCHLEKNDEARINSNEIPIGTIKYFETAKVQLAGRGNTMTISWTEELNIFLKTVGEVSTKSDSNITTFDL